MGFGLVAEHGGKRCGVLRHAGVVLHPVFHRPHEPFSQARDCRGDAFGDQCFGGEVGFQHVTDDVGLGRGVIHLSAEILDSVFEFSCLLGDILRVITGIINVIRELLERVVIGPKLGLQSVEDGLGVVELDLPVLRP